MKHRKKHSNRDDSLSQSMINFVIMSAMGIFLLIYWFNNNQKIDFSDLVRLEGELTSYEYRRSSGGRGYKGMSLFFKIKGYDSEFYRPINYEMFKETLNDSLNLIVTYIEPREKVRLEKGLNGIQILGLQVNSEPIIGIDSAIKQRNFMMRYGILILGIGSCIMGFSDFKRYLRLRRKHKNGKKRN